MNEEDDLAIYYNMRRLRTFRQGCLKLGTRAVTAARGWHRLGHADNERLPLSGGQSQPALPRNQGGKWPETTHQR
jgi:hypothetical protein